MAEPPRRRRVVEARRPQRRGLGWGYLLVAAVVFAAAFAGTWLATRDSISIPLPLLVPTLSGPHPASPSPTASPKPSPTVAATPTPPPSVLILPVPSFPGSGHPPGS